jgi:tetratricopeptide (TPR) repeat protein
MGTRDDLYAFLEANSDAATLDAIRLEMGADTAEQGSTDFGTRIEALLDSIERGGLVAAFLARIETEYPDLPFVKWNGVEAGSEIARLEEKHHDVLHAPPVFLTLRDGVSELNAARQEGQGGAQAAYDGKPFRFVHGYTLPAHWAERREETAALIERIRANQDRLLLLTAIGGTGKSALSRKLLDDLADADIALDGALWFSFYVEPDFDRFLVEACRYLITGFNPQNHPSPYEKSLLLREALNTGHYLLVLDGIEVLLESDRNRDDFGSFRDRALKDFLDNFCEDSRSQILISSRFPLVDLEDKSEAFALALGDLSPDAADSLMESYGVRGGRHDRQNLYNRFGTHALTLQLLGDFLTRYHDGNPHGTTEIQSFLPETPQGVRLQAVLDGYWQHLGTDERFFLTRLAAFRGGVDDRSLLVLNKTGNAFDPKFRQMVDRLVESPLVTVERRGRHARLTAHPLIKTFFYERMGDSERTHAHRTLKDYSQGLPLPERPRTLEDYEPLIEACHHCLQVGLFTEAYQIYRRNNMDNSLRWWGHYTQAMAILEPLREAASGDDPTWRNERWQRSWVENETALIAALRGDSALALERFRCSAEMDASIGDSAGESASFQNMAGVQTQRGEYDAALASLEQSRTREARLNRFDKEEMLEGLEGVIRAEMGQKQEAYDLLVSAYTLSRQSGNNRALCYWMWRLGDLFLTTGQYVEAQGQYQDALEIARREGYRDYESYALRGMGRMYVKTKSLPDARIALTDALRIAQSLGNPFLENEARLSFIALAKAEGLADEARSHAEAVKAKAAACGYAAQLAQAEAAQK